MIETYICSECKAVFKDSTAAHEPGSDECKELARLRKENAELKEKAGKNPGISALFEGLKVWY